MKGRHFAAALTMPLVLAVPAMAQAPADDRSAISTNLLGPSYAPASAPSLPSLANAPEGFSASNFAFTERDGSREFGHRMVGAVPLSRDVRIGVGLMSVPRYSRKEPDFTRAPMKDVEGRRQRIAAVGFSISF
jgi:hypothetical protein